MVNAGLQVSPTENVIIHGGHCNWEGATHLDLRQGDLNYFQPIPGKVPWLPTTLDPRGSSLPTCRPQNGSWHFDPKMVEKNIWQLGQVVATQIFLEFSPRKLILTSIFFRWVVRGFFRWLPFFGRQFWRNPNWKQQGLRQRCRPTRFKLKRYLPTSTLEHHWFWKVCSISFFKKSKSSFGCFSNNKKLRGNLRRICVA